MSKLEKRMREVGVWDSELAELMGRKTRGVEERRREGIHSMGVAVKYAKHLACKPIKILED